MSSFSKSVSAASRSVSHSLSASSNALKESSKASSASVVGAITSKSSTDVQVHRKLRNIADFKSLSGEELNAKIKELTDVNSILQFFSHLVENKLADEVDNLLEDKADEVDHRNPMEVLAAKQQEKKRHIQAANIPLKIQISEIEDLPSMFCSLGNFLCEDYGAKHVALFVGNVLLEWGRESLVIPRIVEQGEEARPNNDVLEVQDITKHLPHNIQADRKAPLADSPLKTVEEELEYMFQRTSEKKPIFEELAKVIARYNTKHYYHPVARNCQGFVKDALQALGITEKPPSPKPSEHMREMQQKKQEGIPSSFARHEDLDAFIMNKSQQWLEDLDADSLEFLQLAYFHFHGDIDCHVPTCKADVLTEIFRR